jgi:hypothetical protein
VLHTLIYASFLEDPILWTLFAIGAALRTAVPIPARTEGQTVYLARKAKGSDPLSRPQS